MADFKAWFIDAEGFLPQANGAILALGLHRFLVLFFFFPHPYLFVLLLLGAGRGEVRGFKIQQGISGSQRSVGLACL